MPTYRCKSQTTLGIGLYLFVPGEVKEVSRFLDHPQLELVSEEPFYNPIISVETLIFSGPGDVKQVDIDFKILSTIIIQRLVGTDISIYINNLSNDPPLPLGEGDKLSLRVNRAINRIFIDPVEAGSCIILVKQTVDTSTGLTSS